MAISTTRIHVSTSEEMEQAISSYIAQGFSLQNKTPTRAVLFKKKEFSALWSVIGFVLCVVPLLIYLIVYAAQSDQMVEIIISPEHAAPPSV